MSETLSDSRVRFDALKAKNLALDMTRGKPGSEQLDLASGMLSILRADDLRAADGTDCRNYGGLSGIAEAKQLFAQMLEVAEDELFIGGNSSLNLMYDMVVRAVLFGVPGSAEPWGKGKVKFFCPVPGYDRHFSICEALGIEMIPVPMNSDGPDMDTVEQLVASDAAIKGMWCVPKYSNPTGATYSDDVVDRLASMKTAAPDFRIFWDNAYSVHFLVEPVDTLKNILEACKAAGNPDRVFLFGSTSKISYAGAGVSFFGTSKANLHFMQKLIGYQTIGHDKLNQLRHVRFFGDYNGIIEHMRKHAAIIRPKFEAVLEILERELGAGDFAHWTSPRGGYFISLDTKPGLAKKVVAMAAELGVKLTAAGATYPLRKDPEDRNIRIAPTLPSLDEIKLGVEVMAVCIKIASLEQAA